MGLVVSYVQGKSSLWVKLSPFVKDIRVRPDISEKGNSHLEDLTENIIFKENKHNEKS